MVDHKSQQIYVKMPHQDKSAQKVDRVTETITENSEQSNMLTLNGTLEMARAGKGFAVVDEKVAQSTVIVAEPPASSMTSTNNPVRWATAVPRCSRAHRV
jgi:hypothetical protein